MTKERRIPILVSTVEYTKLSVIVKFTKYSKTVIYDGPNTELGRTLTVPEPETKDFMRLLVQLTEGTA